MLRKLFVVAMVSLMSSSIFAGSHGNIFKAQGTCANKHSAMRMMGELPLHIGGEMNCSNCGYVIVDKIEEEGPEWRAFSKEEKDDRARTGVPSSLAMHDMGLATVIGAEDRDAAGRSLPASMKAAIERLRTWDGRSQVHEPVDRNLRQAFSELDRLADKLNLSDAVIEKAAYIYRKALEKGLVRGRSISAQNVFLESPVKLVYLKKLKEVL